MSDWKIQSHSGCGVQDFETDYSFTVQQAIGFGFAPVVNVSIPYGILDGDLFQRTRTEAQPFTLVGYIAGSSLADLFTLRDNLIGAVRPDRITPQEPVIIQFTGGTTTIQASCYYDAGLELGEITRYTELGIGLRFRVFNSIWENPTSSSATLAVRDTVASANYIVQRNTSGCWISLSSGMDDTVWAIAVDSDGLLYAGGEFTTAGGTTASLISSWNGVTWEEMPGGPPTLGAVVEALAVDFNNDLYVGGDFVGGSSLSNLIKWDSSASTWDTVVGSPNNPVNTLAIGGDSSLYAGGEFTTIGGSSFTRVAKFDGVDWTSLSTGATCDVNHLGFGLDGTLYATGLFSSPGSAVASWDGTSWSTLGTGFNDNGWIISVAANGEIFFGGDFTTAGGVSASRAAKWDGVNWTRLAGGLNGNVFAMDVSSDDILYVGGAFTQSDTWAFNDAAAFWNGSSWFPLDIDFSDTPQVVAMLAESDGTITMGGTFSGSATTAAVTVVNNGGGGDAFPILSCSGPGRLIQFINSTTGEAIYFDITLNNGEVVTLDLRIGAKSFESNTRGNIINRILPGSDISVWRLSPGDNDISLFINDSSASATMTWSEVA